MCSVHVRARIQEEMQQRAAMVHESLWVGEVVQMQRVNGGLEKIRARVQARSSWLTPGLTEAVGSAK
jgi:hypothetical protein